MEMPSIAIQQPRPRRRLLRLHLHQMPFHLRHLLRRPQIRAAATHRSLIVWTIFATTTMQPVPVHHMVVLTTRMRPLATAPECTVPRRFTTTANMSMEAAQTRHVHRMTMTRRDARETPSIASTIPPQTRAMVDATMYLFPHAMTP